MKLSIKEKLGYSLGDTASHFVWDLVGFWLLIFYTDIYGLSPALAGVIMFVDHVCRFDMGRHHGPDRRYYLRPHEQPLG